MATLILSIGIGFLAGLGAAKGLISLGCPGGIATSIGGYVWIGASVIVLVLRMAKWSAEKCPEEWAERGLDREWWDGYRERAHQLAESQRQAARQAEADGIYSEHTSGFQRLAGRLAQPQPEARLVRQPRHIRWQEREQPEIDYSAAYSMPSQPAPQDDLLEEARKQQEREEWDNFVKANRTERERLIREQEAHTREALRKVEEFNRTHSRPDPEERIDRAERTKADIQARTGYQRQQAADRHNRQLADAAQTRAERMKPIDVTGEFQSLKGAAWQAKQQRQQRKDEDEQEQGR